MSFHVGQKVVCIDPTWGSSGPLQASNCPNLPTKRHIYHVRDVIFYPAYARSFIRLVEICNPPVLDRGNVSEAYFEAHKYRPVVERKTDISIFTAMLTPNTRTPERVG